MASLPKNILTFEEPFGDTNGRKAELTSALEGYRSLLEKKMEDLKIDATEMGKQVLIIGGTVAAVYLLLNTLLPEEETHHNVKPSSNLPTVIERHEQKTSWVTKAVTSYVVTWILGIAQQKLMDFLAIQQNTNAGTNTNETSK
ncbi:hypothetical protein [Runella slithyformis]|uniref:Uncharacterized protein n=1 Tax=Runella slithyformis (strain ATCC 29530 / DSM 19594 / LMG 11500 / NCIMB 11436 / LSU 4) TaxID=761193 RepID=A0A7U4E5R4_RUNSL|nr:hypothetical protein [Runella slithyformis]AEI48594.1 hypothetical protein Runsl_2182 [Runella slithyformis DSM 19594]